MKTIEEKAKAYDKAVEKIKYVMEHGVSPVLNKEDLQDIFSELKEESEDERIRKELIGFCNSCATGQTSILVKDSSQWKRWIAWLEKRCETFTKKDVDDAYLKGVCDTKQELEKQGEQKPAEEYNITGIGSKNAQGKLGEMIKNLKPVNEVLEQKPAWGEEDEEKFSFIHAILIDAKSPNNCASNSTYYREVTESIEWLKSLKDRVGCEANCTTTKAWSEEDEAHFDSIIKRLEEMCKPLSPFVVTRCSINGDKNWLKSLKGRYTWKPSDEQMDTLKEATNIAGGKYKSCLNLLYQDLMKLKG